MAEEEKNIGAGEVRGWFRKSRKKIAGAAVLAVCLIIAGAWLFRSYGLRPSAAVPRDKAEIGMVDLQKAMKAHDAYSQLRELQEQREVMAADLAIEWEEAAAIHAPEIDAAPFVTDVQQKAQQEQAAQGGELAGKRQEAIKAKRAAVAPGYEAARDSIDKEYLNAIFNLRMKLDNADAMHLSPVECADLQRALEDQQHERGERQRALKEQYEGAIRAYAAGLLQQDEAQLQAKKQQDDGQSEAKAMAEQTQAQERNAAAMQQDMMQTDNRAQRMSEKKAALAAKDAEIKAMEEHMLNDIAGKAAKLAILHHLTLILSNPSVNLQAVDVGTIHIGSWPEKYIPAIGVGTIDLTDDLIDELSE